MKKYIVYGVISFCIWGTQGSASKLFAPSNLNSKKKTVTIKVKEIKSSVVGKFAQHLGDSPVNVIISRHDKTSNKDYILASSRRGKMYCYCIQDDNFSSDIILKKKLSITDISCVENFLAIASCDSVLKIYDFEKKEERSLLMCSNDRGMSVAFSDDGKYVGSSGDNGFWYAWNVFGNNEPWLKRSFGSFQNKPIQSGACPVFYKKYCFAVCSSDLIRISTDDNFALILKNCIGYNYGIFKKIIIINDSIPEKTHVGVLTSGENIIICDIVSLKVHNVFSLKQNQKDAFLMTVKTCTHNEKTYLISSYSDGTVCVWDPMFGSCLGKYKIAQNSIRSMTIVNDELWCLEGANNVVKVDIKDFFVDSEKKEVIVY